MISHSPTLQVDESAQKLQALSEFLKIPTLPDDGNARQMMEVLYALMEAGDADALAFLQLHPELCLEQYGEERISAIIGKTKGVIKNIA